MILGIDLGTSNSMAAVYQDGKPVLIQSRTGSHLIPSVVSVDENGMFYTGDVAQARKRNHPDTTVDMFKRSMGTETTFRIGDKEIRAEELSAVLIRGIKEDAEYFLGEEITDAIISVPAFFTNSQRKAVIQAGELAGFRVRRIVNEPTAAAIAYSMQNRDVMEEGEEEQVIIVLDLGGGTFDISVMEVSEGVMEVIAICGDNKLGGGDFTKRLIELFVQANAIEREWTVEEKALLWEQAEKAKYQITREGKGEIRCVFDGQEYTYSITEAEYENACMDLLERIRKLTMRTVEESKYLPEEIDEIIMVGGGTRLSIVYKMIEKMSGKKLDYKINPDEAVAMGAAIQGALLEKNKDVKDLVMTDICPHYIGLYIKDTRGYDTKIEFDVVIPKNTTIPAKRKTIHHSRPAGWVNNVIQSEDRYGIKASELGSIHFRTPELGKETVELHKSITYDINGIIHMEVYVPETGVKYESLIRDDNCELTMEEAKKRMEELQYMNLGPRENEQDSLLMAKAEKMYAEYTGGSRERIGMEIAAFEKAIHDGKVSRIASARANLQELLNLYERADEFYE